MGFVKSKFFLVLGVSDLTLQSISGVNSRIYCVDQNPTPYDTSIIGVFESNICILLKSDVSCIYHF